MDRIQDLLFLFGVTSEPPLNYPPPYNRNRRICPYILQFWRTGYSLQIGTRKIQFRVHWFHTIPLVNRITARTTICSTMEALSSVASTERVALDTLLLPLQLNPYRNKLLYIDLLEQIFLFFTSQLLFIRLLIFILETLFRDQSTGWSEVICWFMNELRKIWSLEKSY